MPPGGGPGAGGMPPEAALVAGHLAGAMASAMCCLGKQLGLFGELAAAGPVTSTELAARSGLDERYLREWLYCLASAGYLEADPATGRFTLPAGLVPVLAAEGSPASLTAGYDLLLSLMQMVPAVAAAFRDGAGIPAERYPAMLYDAMDRMSGTWLDAMLLHQWLPALDGVADRLRAGGRVADIGCGFGRALVLLATAFPAATCEGFDRYEPHLARAAAAAQAAGAGDRVRVVHGDAREHLSGSYDLVTAFDVLHDVPDPAGLLRAVRAALAPHGALLVLESASQERPLANVGPPATILYATSVLHCLPSSRVDGGCGSGTLGMPAERVRTLATEAGFGAVRQLPSMNPFNALYEIRP